MCPASRYLGGNKFELRRDMASKRGGVGEQVLVKERHGERGRGSGGLYISIIFILCIIYIIYYYHSSCIRLS